MEELMKLAQGNPGAINYLMQVFANPETDFGTAAAIENKLKRCKTLRGTNIYILFSDLCGGDLNKVYKLCTACPDDILEDACSRQDYSGRKLVEPYIG